MAISKEEITEILKSNTNLERLAIKCGIDHARRNNHSINEGPFLLINGSVYYEMVGTLDGGDGVDDVSIPIEEFVIFINQNSPT